MVCVSCVSPWYISFHGGITTGMWEHVACFVVSVFTAQICASMLPVYSQVYQLLLHWLALFLVFCLWWNGQRQPDEDVEKRHMAEMLMLAQRYNLVERKAERLERELKVRSRRSKSHDSSSQIYNSL